MDRYVYILGGLALLTPSVAILARRKDLRGVTLLYGTIGGLSLLITEFVYTQDYWSPPTIMGTRISVEDFIFGFAIAAFPIVSFPAITRRYLTRAKYQGHLGIVLTMGAVAAGALFTLPQAIGLNSIVLSCSLLMAYTIVVCAIRRDLILVAALSIVYMTALMAPAYAIFFNLIAPEWWDRYWHISSHEYLGITVLGRVPLMELVVYFTWAGFGSTVYLFIHGRGLEPQEVDD